MADIIQHGGGADNGHSAPGQTVVMVDEPPSNANSAANKESRQGAVRFQGLQLNVWYFRTVPGILKIVEWVFGIICIACASPPYLDAAHWFVFVAVFCFIFTFVWACVHFFSLTSVIGLPWLLIEIGYTILAMVLYFIAFIVLLVNTAKEEYTLYYGSIYYAHPAYHYYNAYLAAGSFGVFNFIVYAAETLFHAKTYLDTRKETAT